MFTFSNEVFENKSQFDNSGSRPNLGLNKARLEKVEYLTSDKGTSYAKMHFLVGTTPMNASFFNITNVYVNGNQISVENVKSEEEQKALSKETSKIASAFYQLITCYIPAEDAQQQLQEFQQQVGTFTLETLVKAFNKIVSFEMYSDVDIDVFCVHQKLTDDGKEYLTIQSKPYPGETIFTKHMGDYTEHLTEETKAGKPVKTLVYLNAEGKEHPIKRGNWFLTSEHTGWLSKLKTTSSSSPLLGSVSNAATPEQAQSQVKNIFG